jgi:hypothetical protein
MRISLDAYAHHLAASLQTHYKLTARPGSWDDIHRADVLHAPLNGFCWRLLARRRFNAVRGTRLLRLRFHLNLPRM